MESNQNEIKELKDLFTSCESIYVPSYQRAYAWTDKQYEQFVNDILELSENGHYYYGHYILESDTLNNKYAVIDGQQRLTTFILFLLVCHEYKPNTELESYINVFETVDYDLNEFRQIVDSILKSEISTCGSDTNSTMSVKRMKEAIHYFRKQFDSNRLKANKVDSYINLLLSSYISTHITDNKAVAVQIFELHNTRGVQLSLIEKVKSKLMKAIYLSSNNEDKESVILELQEHFAKIYRLEETIEDSMFRSEMSLDDILYHHLKMIDDGSKIKQNIGSEWWSIFQVPQIGYREDSILKYLDDKISNPNINTYDYIIELVKLLSVSVEFVSQLKDLDRKNTLIGDSFILDKNRTLEFTLLLKHLNKENELTQSTFVLWENLLFKRDLNGLYWQQKIRDKFEELYHNIITGNKSISDNLNSYCKNSFREEILHKENKNKTLNEAVFEFLKEQKNRIITDAFNMNWLKNKFIYILYKYELYLTSDNVEHRNLVRQIIKDGISVEHIFPQTWYELGEGSYSDEFKKKINGCMNGIGNLLLVTKNQNSSLGKNHPKDKIYKTINDKQFQLGSYGEHNNNRIVWGDNNKWEAIITERGNKIFDFLLKFVKQDSEKK